MSLEPITDNLKDKALSKSDKAKYREWFTVKLKSLKNVKISIFKNRFRWKID